MLLVILLEFWVSSVGALSLRISSHGQKVGRRKRSSEDYLFVEN